MRDHEEATLVAFKIELMTLLDKYADAPGAREMVWTVRERCGLRPVRNTGIEALLLHRREVA